MKTATSAVLVGTSHKTGPCPITGQEVNKVYQCFPTGRFVRASSEQAALESHNASRISSPESASQKPEPALVQATLAFWETTKQATKIIEENNMSTTTHLVAVHCAVIPASDTRPTRVRLTLPRFGKKLIFPWDYSCDASEAPDQAAHWLNSRGVKHCAFLDLGEDGSILAVEWELVPQLLDLFKNKKPNKYKKS